MRTQILYSAINIKFVDQGKQSPKNYQDLFKFINSNMLVGHGYGKNALMVGTLSDIHEGGESVDGIYGLLHKYFDLPADTKWFDLVTMQPVSDKNKVSVSTNYKPEYKSIGYVFYPKKHRLIYDCKHMTPKSVCKALKQIFNNVEIKEKYGEIEVIIESSREAIEEILNTPYKRSIEIMITIPNPDELSSLDARFYDNMKQRNIYKHHLYQSSKSGEGLMLGEDEITLVRLSASNGKTTLKTTDGGNVVVKSTEDYPLKYPKEYDINTQTYTDAVKNAAEEIIKII